MKQRLYQINLPRHTNAQQILPANILKHSFQTTTKKKVTK